jgi:hypothetical protein
LIEVGKPKEGLDLLDLAGDRPVPDGGDLLFVHPETVGGHDESKVFAFGHQELTLVSAGKQSVQPETSEYFANSGSVLGGVFRVNKDVIEVDHYGDVK